MHPPDEGWGFPVLSPGVLLTRLEVPSLYDAGSDELYELTGEAFDLLSRCDGVHSLSELEMPQELLDYCLLEGLLRIANYPLPRRVPVLQNENPSLRYLMVEVTDRCNLHCRHCYLGEAGKRDIDVEVFRGVVEAFADMGGLRLIVTGGEPLLHPDFARLNQAVHGLTCRTVLATNGTLLSAAAVSELNFREVQISLDGMRSGHESLRGDGTFEAALAGCRAVRDEGLELSIATMIHSRNLGELAELEVLVRQLGAAAWALDIPVEAGRFTANRSLAPDLPAAVPYLELAFGEGVHEQGDSGGCGAHLACIDVSGSLLKCGYYRDLCGGAALPDLRGAWLAMPRTGLPVACADCDYVAECAGGCRFRAEQLGYPGLRDPVRCLQFGREL